MTQREERVDAARSLSRNETRDQRHGREECRQAAKRDRIRGLDVEEQGLQESRQRQRPDQPPRPWEKNRNRIHQRVYGKYGSAIPAGRTY